MERCTLSICIARSLSIRSGLLLVQELATLVGSRQDSREVADMLKAVLALSGKESGRWQMAARQGLGEGMRRRGVPLAAFLQTLPAGRQDLLRRINGQMTRTLALARDGQGSASERIEAVQELAQVDWKTARPLLARLLAAEPSTEIRLAAVRAAAGFPEPEVAVLLVKVWKTFPPTVAREATEALLSRPERTLVFLTEMESGRISAGDLDASRRLQLLNHRRSDIRARAHKLLATVATPERRKVLDEYRAALRLPGDAVRGKQVFQKATCASCHRLGGVGVQVGPDIADVRTRSPEALLVDILDPNAAIDAHYVNYLVTLKNGKVLTGIIASETASSITLSRGDEQTNVILRQDIEPDGLVSTGKVLDARGFGEEYIVSGHGRSASLSEGLA